MYICLDSIIYRYYTHGCDFWSPRESVVYHLWSRSHRIVPQRTDIENRKILKMKEASKLSQNRVKQLLRGELAVDDAYGLGSIVSLKEFEESIGVNFTSQIIALNSESLSDELFAKATFDSLFADTASSNTNRRTTVKHNVGNDNKINVLELVQQYMSI